MTRPIFSTNVTEGPCGTNDIQLFIYGEQVTPEKFAAEANKLYDSLAMATKRLQEAAGISPIDLAAEKD